MGMVRKKKVRVDMRKNRTKPPRKRDWSADEDASPSGERIRAKGDLSRKRTIIQHDAEEQATGQAPADMPAVDASECLPGRVLRVQGLLSIVQVDDGRLFRCAVRRLLK